jgi:hypothetical protein
MSEDYFKVLEQHHLMSPVLQQKSSPGYSRMTKPYDVHPLSANHYTPIQVPLYLNLVDAKLPGLRYDPNYLA